MAGGREMLMPTSTLAGAGTGDTNTNAISVVPIKNFFI
jgi:hypothetical protein